MYYVVRVRNNDRSGLFGTYGSAYKVAGPFNDRSAANRRKSELDAEKREVMNDRSNPGRGEAAMTTYIVWSDEEVEAMKNKGCRVS